MKDELKKEKKNAKTTNRNKNFGNLMYNWNKLAFRNRKSSKNGKISPTATHAVQQLCSHNSSLRFVCCQYSQYSPPKKRNPLTCSAVPDQRHFEWPPIPGSHRTTSEYPSAAKSAEGMTSAVQTGHHVRNLPQPDGNRRRTASRRDACRRDPSPTSAVPV